MSGFKGKWKASEGVVRVEGVGAELRFAGINLGGTGVFGDGSMKTLSSLFSHRRRYFQLALDERYDPALNGLTVRGLDDHGLSRLDLGRSGRVADGARSRCARPTDAPLVSDLP